MHTSQFSFKLPQHLIACSPPARRGSSRLMLMNREGYPNILHRSVDNLPDLVESGTLMVFNDTRVRKARVYATNSATGGRGEFLFLHPAPGGGWICLSTKLRKKRTGQLWNFPMGIQGCIKQIQENDLLLITLNPEPDESWFEEFGHIPLPPYLQRPDGPEDAERYQTVYARQTGSAAAPTAGLHFTRPLLQSLASGGVEIRWVTLKVGLGTFAPVRARNIADHIMHTEEYSIPAETAVAVEKAKREGRPVLAVGTTSLRTLEAAWQNGHLRSGNSSTDIFIYPGYKFSVVDALFTNFHTPESTLLMLVSAFAGRERILNAYQKAIEMEYRFFSYGDAMLIQ